MGHGWAAYRVLDERRRPLTPAAVAEGWIVDFHDEIEVAKHSYDVQITERAILVDKERVKEWVKEHAGDLSNYEPEQEAALMERFERWDEESKFTLMGRVGENGDHLKIVIKPATWTASLQWND